jgi:hypothetical protein
MGVLTHEMIWEEMAKDPEEDPLIVTPLLDTSPDSHGSISG